MVLTDLLASHLSELLPMFVNLEHSEPESSSPLGKLSVTFVPCEKPSDEADYLPVGALCIELPQKGARITTKTRGIISPLGEIIAHNESAKSLNVFKAYGTICGK